MSAGAHDELGNAIGVNLPRALRIQGLPALVVVIVRGQDDVYLVLHEQGPHLIQARGVTLRPNAVDRMVKVDDGARCGAGLQVLLQPEILGRRAYGLIKLSGGIQADKVPARGIKAVVMGDVVPIIKVAGSGAVLVFVIANRRIGGRRTSYKTRPPAPFRKHRLNKGISSGSRKQSGW
jgi:hypothetical protein